MPSDRAQILITAIDQTKQAFASVKGNLEGLMTAAKSVNGVLAGLGAALTVGGLVAAGKSAIDLADDLNDMRQKTGLSVESLSLLKPIAEESGTSLEGLATGIKKLSVAMVEAAGGSKEQVALFAQLGVSVTDAAGQLRPTEQVLLDLADAFAGMPDGAEKSALAVKLFGKSGLELIPFLNQGRSGIEELKDKFRELGIEISGDTASAADNFNDTLDTVNQALHGIAMQITAAALPTLQALADGLVVVASHGDELMAALRIIGEGLVVILAGKGVAAVAKLLESFNLLKLTVTRFLPVLLAIGLWEMGRGIVQMVQDIRESNQAIETLNRQREQLQQLSAAMDELANSGTVSVKTQMWLAAQAAERLRAALPGTAESLKAIQGAATQVGKPSSNPWIRKPRKPPKPLNNYLPVTNRSRPTSRPSGMPASPISRPTINVRNWLHKMRRVRNRRRFVSRHNRWCLPSETNYRLWKPVAGKWNQPGNGVSVR